MKVQTQPNLFSDQSSYTAEPLCEGGVLLHGFALSEQRQLFAHVTEMARLSPFRHMITPGGFRMSIAITNCGKVGWISDRKGYRYAEIDPETGRSWPPMPALFSELATRAAAAGGFPQFVSDACLINRYEPGARLTLHQDRNEIDFEQPIVSVSLGLPATFLFGGATRKERPRRYRLESGDVVVWGGPARLAFHGVAALKEGVSDLTGAGRINLTFRKAL
jgi:alkylated DNA repair protein (DNA oxidative demethylase)